MTIEQLPLWRTVELLGIAAAIFLAATNYYQWKDLRHNFEVDQRAWVTTTDYLFSPQAGKPAGWTVNVKNFGRSPALKVNISVTMQSIDNIAWHKSEILKLIDATRPNANFVDGPIPPGGQAHHYFEYDTIPPSFIPLVERRMAFFVLFGKIFYQDIFGEPHTTSICLLYDAKTPPDSSTYCGFGGDMK